MIPQLDLFALAPRPQPALAAPAVAALPTPIDALPRRTIAWERLIARATHTDLLIVVSSLWTGVTLEVLSDPALGRQWLDKDRTIGTFPPDKTYGRTVYMTADQLAALQRRFPLERVGTPGSASTRFRFRPHEGSQA